MSVVYGTMANMAGAAIQNFRIGPSLSNRIGTSDSNSNRILKLHRSLVHIAFADIDTTSMFVTPKYRQYRYIVNIVYCSAVRPTRVFHYRPQTSQ